MLHLAKVQSKDLDEYTSIAIESFKEDKEKYGEYPPLIDIEKRKLKYINDAHTFKIMFDNQMIGGVIIFQENNQQFILGSIFIKPEFQGKGIGQEVMLLSELEFPKAVSWTLDTPCQSYRNHYLYEKLGYKKIREEKPDEDNDFTLFIYEKRINEN